MAVKFECPNCKAGYEVADDLANKVILCRVCQKRGTVRAAGAKATPSSGGVPSVALPSSKPSRRQTLKIVAGIVASVASIATGAVLARNPSLRPWRHWKSESGERRRRGGPDSGGGSPPTNS